MNAAFRASHAPAVVFQDLFQLIGPEDYTFDFLTDGQRDEKATVVRTIGRCDVAPVAVVPGNTVVNYAAALFVEGERNVISTFTASPTAYSIHLLDAAWPQRMRDLSIMQWWAAKTVLLTNLGLAADAAFGAVSSQNVISPERLYFEWDVTQRRKMKTDEALWLLVAGQALAIDSEPDDAVELAVQARSLIHDQ